MQNIQKISDYSTYYDRVIRWNERAKGKTVFTDTDLQNQAKFVKEEVEEMFEAYDTRGEDEFYKELADVFVVTSFYDYLKHGREFTPRTVHSDHIELLLSYVGDYIDNNYYGDIFYTVITVMNSLIKTPEEYLVPVLDSNDSKFFEEENSNVELEYAKKTYGGRYQGITVHSVGDGLAVLRDSNDKIIKPSTYKEWSAFV